MTIEEAIQIKTRWKMQNYPPPLADEINADNLSIEALKRLQEQRSGTGPLYEDDLLPGETVDQHAANIGYGSSEALKRHK